jgi:hypothetical protein
LAVLPQADVAHPSSAGLGTFSKATLRLLPLLLTVGVLLLLLLQPRTATDQFFKTS